MLEAVDDIQYKEDCVKNDENQVDFTFCIPDDHNCSCSIAVSSREMLTVRVIDQRSTVPSEKVVLFRAN